MGPGIRRWNVKKVAPYWGPRALTGFVCTRARRTRRCPPAPDRLPLAQAAAMDVACRSLEAAAASSRAEGRASGSDTSMVATSAPTAPLHLGGGDAVICG